MIEFIQTKIAKETNMAEQELTQYIKQNLAEGFSDGKIREALGSAGWTNEEVQDAFREVKSAAAGSSEKGHSAPYQKTGFFSAHRKLITTLIILLVVLPILAFGGLWFYQNQKETNTADQVKGEFIQNPKAREEARQRDLTRLREIRDIQLALNKYFEGVSEFPQSLKILAEKNLLGRIARDPKTDKDYVYSALGNPPLFYSLAFLLETSVGTMRAGLHVASADEELPLDQILREEAVMRGEEAGTAGDNLIITKLEGLPFYPQEEVILEITNPAADMQTAILVKGDLKLIDDSLPFRFTFTAPRDPGSYPIKMFAFDAQNQIHSQATNLIVIPRP